MKLDNKRIDFEYTPGEGTSTPPEGIGLSLFFDVDEGLADSPSVMDAAGEMLGEAGTLVEEAKATVKVTLADESSPYHGLVTFFMQFHWDDVGPDVATDLFPGTDPAELSFIEVVDFPRLKRSDSLVDGKIGQQALILDLSFNPGVTDELMVVYFDLNKEIFCITHES